MATADTSSSLLVRIRDPDDSVSWTLFVEVYTPVVFRYLKARGLQDADAEDLTQETLIAVVTNIRNFQYNPEKGRFRDWLSTVTRRRLFRFWQKSKNSLQSLDEGQGQAGLDPEWLDAWQSELLRAAIERVRREVEPRTWQAFSRTWIDNIPASQVSQELEIPIDLVYSAKARFLRRLEAEIRMLGDESVWIDARCE